MNTGLRRGELLEHCWTSVDLNRRLPPVEGHHVPLIDEAINVLHDWHEQSGDSARMLEITTGFKASRESLLKRAGVTRFPLLDLHHHFGRLANGRDKLANRRDKLATM